MKTKAQQSVPRIPALRPDVGLTQVISKSPIVGGDRVTKTFTPTLVKASPAIWVRVVTAIHRTDGTLLTREQLLSLDDANKMWRSCLAVDGYTHL